MRKIKGLTELVGQKITVFCTNYIYHGKLLEVTPRAIKLEDAAVVYETGDFDDKVWRDIQKVNGDWYIAVSKIESFGVMTKDFPVEK
jgi:hypothetical protein